MYAWRWKGSALVSAQSGEMGSMDSISAVLGTRESADFLYKTRVLMKSLLTRKTKRTSPSVLCELSGQRKQVLSFAGEGACGDLAVVRAWLVIYRQGPRSPCRCRSAARRTLLFHLVVFANGHDCGLPSHAVGPTSVQICHDTHCVTEAF